MTKALSLITFFAFVLGQVAAARDLAEVTRECTETPKCIVYVSDKPSPPPTDGSCPIHTDKPSASPTVHVSDKPSAHPSAKPSVSPSGKPSANPTSTPSSDPSVSPSAKPSTPPSGKPSANPSAAPSAGPTGEGESAPSETPSDSPFVVQFEEECPDVPLDICIAIDMSGSVCTIPPNGARTCYPDSANTTSKSSCWSPGECPHILEVRDFVTSIVKKVHSIGGNKQFSMVTFSDSAKTIHGLTDSESTAVNAVQGAAYVGGYTHTGGGIKACADTLTNVNSERLILLVTDGTPTRPSSGALSYANQQATLAKNAGITILPVYIQQSVSSHLGNMQDFASNRDDVIEVQEFDELPGVLNDVLDKIDCDVGSQSPTGEGESAPSETPSRSPFVELDTSNVVGLCSSISDDFSDGFEGWSTYGSSSRYTSWRVLDGYNVQGSLRMKGGSSTTYIEKSFDNEIQKMNVETQVTVKFDACYTSVENYQNDDLILTYNTGSGWSTVEEWKSRDLSSSSNTGCHRGAEVSFNVPAATSTLDIRFEFTGGHSSDTYYMTQIDTDICTAPIPATCVAMIDDTFDSGKDGWVTSGSQTAHSISSSTFPAMNGYIELPCPGSSTTMTKIFNQVMPYDTTLSIDFDFCFDGLETYQVDKLDLLVKIGSGSFQTIGTWSASGMGTGKGCRNGAKQVTIPANTPEVQVQFKATGTYVGEHFYIDRVRTEWCEDGACPLKVLDFNVLTPNTYVGDLQAEYGVTVKAIKSGGSGYTPDNKAMVFDTTRPTGAFGCGSSGDNGDIDLGAPNRKCPGGGPGKGKWVTHNGVSYETGGPDSPHPNCNHIGNVLVIQESNKNCPDDSASGGWIEFEFAQGVDFEFAGLLDTDESNTPDITLTDVSGSDYPVIHVTATGDNGYTQEYADLADVKKISIRYHGSGSIAALGYRVCPV